MPITIYDVAKKAGVGIGTVSRVLNDSPKVRITTRNRVMAAIQELHYHPNPMAQRMAYGKTLAIGVITRFFTRPSFVERLRGIEASVAESEYDLIVYNVETLAKRERYFRTVPMSHRVDGLIIICLPPTDADVERFIEEKLPTVLVDTYHPNLSRVVVDDVSGGRMATQYLISLGHRKIAYLSDPLNDPLASPFRFTSSLYRYQGYRQALEEAEIPFVPRYHQAAEHSLYQAKVLAHRLLSLPDPPTAIFAASDTQAMGALEAAREKGIRVPEELSVIGFDDIEIAAYLRLTTIRQPLYESGLRSVEILLSHLDRPQEQPRQVNLALELVIRDTTAPPRH